MMPRVERRIKFHVEKAILNSPEVKSLTDELGVLRRELGVLNGAGRMSIIINRWLEGIKVTAQPIRVSSNSSLKGGLKIVGIKKSGDEVLGMDQASFLSEGNYEIPFLEWLLFKGNSVINREWGFSLVIGQGRTNQGIMVKNGKYVVPQEFAGVNENNFVTRSLDTIEPMIVQILRDEFLR